MLKDLFLKRQSCRNFDNGKPVEKEKLERIMENVRLAPSARNTQPYTFWVITDETLAKKVSQQVQLEGKNKHCENVNCFIVVCEENANMSALSGGRVPDQAFAQIDMGLAVSQLVLSAEEEGLSTCILGWFDEDEIKNALAIKPDSHVRLVVAVGYAAADDKIREKKRKDIRDYVFFK